MTTTHRVAAQPLAPEVIEAILRNNAFQQQVTLANRVLDLDLVRQAWPLLALRYQQVLAMMYTQADQNLTPEQAGAQIGLSTLASTRYSYEALLIIRRFLERPHSWVGLPDYVRELLLENGVTTLPSSSRKFIYELLQGQHGYWGPRESFALNERLVSLGQDSLQARLPGGFVERFPLARWRLGLDINPTADNVARVLANPTFAAGISRTRQQLNAGPLRPAWDCLTLGQQEVIVAMYGAVGGTVAVREAAARLRLLPSVVAARHKDAMRRMRAFLAQTAHEAATNAR
jgi:hypothetical protein